MQFRILGPLEVHGPQGRIEVAGGKPAAVLAVLLLHRNQPVSAGDLAIALWGDDVPGGAVKTVQVYVSRLRKALGDSDILTTTPAGYCLTVRPGELDADRFSAMVAEGRQALEDGEAAQASQLLREALALRRGPPLADFASASFASTEIARLEEQWLDALDARLEADLAVGRHGEVVAELQQLVAEHPTHEQLVEHLMLALYRCGRQTDALDAYREARNRLVAEVGVEPGPGLRALQDAILQQDPSLLGDGAAELPRELERAASTPLEGRDEELAWLRERWQEVRAGAGALVTVRGENGIGKSRLAAEFASEAHDRGATVLYADGGGSPAVALSVLARARHPRRPTVLVVDDVNRAPTAVREELQAFRRAASNVPVLVLALDGESNGDPGSDALVLPPLDVGAVHAIVTQYVPEHGDEPPEEWLLGASRGVPGLVHELAGEWARREAARRIRVGAERTAARRADLRTGELELAADVAVLEVAREGEVRDIGPGSLVCPFKGLASFQVADAPYFFGREKLVAALVARLVGAPLLGIVGPSGSGKSSVLRAGLLPALAAGVLPGSERCRQVLIRPGAHPLAELRAALARESEEPIVLAVDQFEETFTICDDEQERVAFVAELARLSHESDGDGAVVLAVRADFYGRCAEFPELSRQLAANHVLVGGMRADELRRAVESPAQRAGLVVEPELADALVADVKGEPGALPLLSTALLELWQQREGRHLRHSTYLSTGGVRGAVARLAEAAFSELGPAEQVVARNLLLRLTAEGAEGAVERQRVPLDELEVDRNEEVARVVGVLTDRRLLTVSAGTLELAHEALLREWPRLRGWIDADREGLRIHRKLSADAQEWDKLGRDSGALWRGSRLREATEWNAERQPRLNEAERAFLTASQAARERDRVARRRRFTLAFGSLTVALIAISIVALVSIVQGQKTASRELANRSSAVIAGDPALALAIGLEAMRRHDTPEAQRAVRQATLADRSTAVIRPRPTSVLLHAALSPDGSRVAAAGEDGLVRVVRLDGASVESTIKGHDGPAVDVAFSPDGEHVATVGLDGEVAITEPDGDPRRVVLRLDRDAGLYARSVEYDADGRRLVVAVSDGTIRLIRISDAESSTFATHTGVRVARFDPDGRRILSAGEDGFVRVWDSAGGLLASMPQGNGVDVFDSGFSPDGRQLATAAGDGALRIWDVAAGRLVRKVAVDLQPLFAMQFSADGRRIVTAGADGVVRVSAVRGGPVLAELKGHRDRVYDAGFLGDADDAYSVGMDGTVRTWAPLRTASLPTAQGNVPFAPSFSPDGKHVISGSLFGTVLLWDPAKGSVSERSEHQGNSAALYSADGSYVLSSAQDGTARLWDVERERSSRLRLLSDASVIAAAIDRTGSRIATAADHEPVLVQGPDGANRVTLPHGQVNSLAFSPDGKHLVSASEDGTVRIWNADSGAPERDLEAGESAVLDVRYSPDGERIATARADGSIDIWSLDGGDPTVLYGHDGLVNAIAFDPDGDRLVSGGTDGTVRVWDTAGGETLVLLHRHEGAVTGAAFSPDGKQVVSGADDGLWVSECEVCGAFPEVASLARTRPEIMLTEAERTRLVSGGG